MKIFTFDTTLRDGTQGESVSFSVDDKLVIAQKLDELGIDYIEGGWPGSNPKDIEFFEQAKRKKFRHARLAAFGSTRRKGVPVEKDEQVRLLLDADTPVVTLVAKTWLLHVKEVLRTTPDENLAMIGDTIRFLKNHVAALPQERLGFLVDEGLHVGLLRPFRNAHEHASRTFYEHI